MTIQTITSDDLTRLDSIVRELLEDRSHEETRRTPTEVTYEGARDGAFWVLDLTPRHAVLTVGHYVGGETREREHTLRLDTANDVLFLEGVLDDTAQYA